MNFIAVVLVFLMEHYADDIRKCRRYGWISRYRRLYDRKMAQHLSFNSSPGLLVFLLIPVLALLLLQWWVAAYLGILGELMLVFFALAYLIGPGSLKNVVDELIKGDVKALPEMPEALDAADDLSPGDAVAAITRAALRRWFTPLFWLLLLGPAAALAYRMLEQSWHEDDDVMALWLAVFEWPVAQLMALTLALVGNFNSVIGFWRGQRCPMTGRMFDVRCHFLYSAMEAAVLEQSGSEGDAGEESEMELSASANTCWHLITRMLMAWLTILAILTLAGWLN